MTTSAIPETEAGFQAAVRELAKVTGWLDYHTHDSRRSPEGFPDLVLVREGRVGRMIIAELKTERGRVTAAQQRWLDALATVTPIAPNVQVFLWRPSDWPEIERQLKSQWPLS